MKTRQWLSLIFGASFAILFLWLMARQIRFDDIERAFDSVSVIWIAAATITFFAGYACRIERWRLMLERDSPGLKWTVCAGPFLASFAVNNILPFRAGDALRSFAFNEQLGTSYGVTIATLFVERLLDLLMVLVLLGAALVLFEVDIARFTGVDVALIAGALIVLVLLFFPRYLSPLASGIGRIAVRLLPRFGRKLADEIDRSLATLLHLAGASIMPKLVFWSLLAWVAEGCVFWFVALALPSISAPLAGWLALPVGTMATLIPSTPGYIGTFDYFAVRAMTELGNTTAGAMAYAILVHILLWLPPTAAGGLYLLLHPVRRSQRLQAIRS